MIYSFSNPGSTDVLVGVWDNDEYGPNPQGGGVISDLVAVTAPAAGPPPYVTTSVSAKLQANAGHSADPPLVTIDTTDPAVTSARQVSVTVGAPSSANTPVPLVTGVALIHLPGGVSRIVLEGVVSAVQPGAGLVASAPLNITVGTEPTLTAEVAVDETPSVYAVNPVSVVVSAGQRIQNVQVATLAGPPNRSYAAAINWGDGDTSSGIIMALGGGLFSIRGSKPHPYAAAGADAVTVTVSGPGTIPAPAAVSLADVLPAVSLAQSTLSMSPAAVPVGGTAIVTMTGRDLAGNPQGGGGLNVQFALGAGNGGGALSNVTDKGDGTYTATFTAATPGTNTVIATVNGQPIPMQASFAVPNSPGGTSATDRPTFLWAAVPGATYELWVNDQTTGQSALLDIPQLDGHVTRAHQGRRAHPRTQLHLVGWGRHVCGDQLGCRPDVYRRESGGTGGAMAQRHDCDRAADL